MHAGYDPARLFEMPNDGLDAAVFVIGCNQLITGVFEKTLHDQLQPGGGIVGE